MDCPAAPERVAFVMIRRNRTELGLILVSVVLLVFFCMPQAFVWGTGALGHDNFFWRYPLFHFFFGELFQGYLPFWNFYSHGGEPFYPMLGVVRLNDPTTFVFASFFRLFTVNLTLVFHWTILAQLLFWLTGIYWIVRKFARSDEVRLILAPIVFLSCFILNGLRQDGFHNQFFWVPWILILFQQLGFSPRNPVRTWALFGVLLGLNFESYHFVSVWLFLLFMILAAIAVRRDLFTTFVRNIWAQRRGVLRAQ
jgi:hypothetical protein